MAAPATLPQPLSHSATQPLRRSGKSCWTSHSATQSLRVAEWLSGWSSHSGRVAEWLSGWSSHSGRVAEWLSGCFDFASRVAHPLIIYIYIYIIWEQRVGTYTYMYVELHATSWHSSQPERTLFQSKHDASPLSLEWPLANCCHV